MKILVTGGAGFIGSNIVDAYVAAGHAVVVVDDLSSGKKSNLNPKAKFYQQDITSPQLAEIFLDEKPDLVNHHAAQIDVRKSIADPAGDIKTNVIGMVNVLNGILNLGKITGLAPKIIFSSTGGALYGEVKDRARETDLLFPVSPYAIDKRAAEMYLYAYSENYGIKYTVLRYGNVYGPRQDPHGEAGVVAIFCGKLLAGDSPFIFGDGEQLRDYVFVEDVVAANLLALTKGSNAIFNIGTAYGASVNELFQILKSAAKFTKAAIYQPARLGELQRSVLSFDKARRELGWEPKVSLEAGLRKTLDYFSQIC